MTELPGPRSRTGAPTRRGTLILSRQHHGCQVSSVIPVNDLERLDNGGARFLRTGGNRCCKQLQGPARPSAALVGDGRRASRAIKTVEWLREQWARQVLGAAENSQRGARRRRA